MELLQWLVCSKCENPLLEVCGDVEPFLIEGRVEVVDAKTLKC